MSTVSASPWIPISRWAPLAGNWEIDDCRVHFISRSAPGGPGLCVCDEKLQGGRIRSKVQFEGPTGEIKEDSAGIVLGYNSESGGYLIIGLGAFWIRLLRLGVHTRCRLDKS